MRKLVMAATVTVCTWAVGEAFNCASEVAWNARTSG